MVKLYEVWPAKNLIYCRGQLMTGPDRLAFWVAQLLIYASFVVFWVFICKPFAEEYSWSPVFIFGSVFILAMIVSTHYLGAFTEPGIVPRTNNPIPSQIYREEEIDGNVVVIYFCKTCRIWKQPRTHHCRDCDNCILEFDHHCPWVGNCIGKRNYRWFNLFLHSIIVAALYIGGVTAFHAILIIFESDKPLADIISKLYVHIGLEIWALIMFISIVGLCGYHCCLIWKGETTYESIKRIRGNRLHDSSCFSFYSVLCGPQIPSLFNLQDHVDDDTERVLYRRVGSETDRLRGSDEDNDALDRTRSINTDEL